MKTLRIEIYTYSASGGSANGNQETTTEEGGAGNKKNNPLFFFRNPMAKLRKANPATAYVVTSAFSLAKQASKQAIMFRVSDIGRRTGDSNYQAIIDRELERVFEVKDFALSMFAGGMAGAVVGGPIGAVIGVGISAISSAASLHFKYATRERAYQHEMFKESNSQAYNLARANYSIYTGRAR